MAVGKKLHCITCRRLLCTRAYVGAHSFPMNLWTSRVKIWKAAFCIDTTPPLQLEYGVIQSALFVWHHTWRVSLWATSICTAALEHDFYCRLVPSECYGDPTSHLPSVLIPFEFSRYRLMPMFLFWFLLQAMVGQKKSLKCTNLPLIFHHKAWELNIELN